MALAVALTATPFAGLLLLASLFFLRGREKISVVCGALCLLFAIAGFLEIIKYQRQLVNAQP